MLETPPQGNVRSSTYGTFTSTITQISQLLQISVHGCRKLVSKAIMSLREKFDSSVKFKDFQETRG